MRKLAPWLIGFVIGLLVGIVISTPNFLAERKVDRMAKYGNILLVKNPSTERVKPVTDYLDGNKLPYVYRSQVLFYVATKMSQLDDIEKIAKDDGMEFVNIHSHTLPGNLVSSNFLDADTLASLEKVWTPD